MAYPSYLMHYGVKGQKWGERQYQFLDGTYTELGKERRRIGSHDYSNSSYKINKTYGSSSGTKNNKSSFNKKGLTEKQKIKISNIEEDIKIINGTLDHATYTRKINCPMCTMSYELRRRGEDVRAQESLSALPIYDYSSSGTNSAYRDVIPDFDKIIKDRKRDYGKAKAYQKYVEDYRELIEDDKLFKKLSKTEQIKIASKFNNITNHKMSKKETEQINEDILKDGKNSRGFVTVSFTGGNGGHIFNYEVVDGKLIYVDSQSGEIIDSNKIHSHIFNNCYEVNTLRTDDIKINTDKAKEKFSEPTDSKIKKLDKEIDYASETQKINKTASASSIIGSIIGAVGASALAANIDAIDDESIPSIASLGGLVGSVLGYGIGLAIGTSKFNKITSEDRSNTENIRDQWIEENRLRDNWYEFRESDLKDLERRKRR